MDEEGEAKEEARRRSSQRPRRSRLIRRWLRRRRPRVGGKE